MELRQLDMFVAAADRNSITDAAQALLVAQPSVSTQIRALEKELGYPLFDRLPRGVRLTDVGRAVLPHARQILRHVGEIREAIDELAGLQRGQLVLGTMPSITAHLIPTVIKTFRQAFPNVDLRVVESRASSIVDGVIAHRFDLGVVTNAQPHPQIEIAPLLAEEIFAILPVDDSLAGRDEIDLAELADRSFIVLEPGFSLRSVLLEACRQAGFSPRIAQEMSSIQAIKGLVEIGMGVSLAPRMAVVQEERLGLLRALHLRSRPYRQLQIITSKGSYLPRSAQAFIRICQEEATRSEQGPSMRIDPAPERG
ncbi:MAG: LysR substrate-binding domain-containing protein [Thermaerobacter sp.]|nr:LysR substrate-binding domain-containing protein [Thermaerobacter sp.]